MGEDQSEIKAAAFELLKQEIELPALEEHFDEEKAIRFIANAIGELLNRDFERLLQICYRIDLGEEKLKTILYKSEPDQIALDLARALWERHKQKAEIRRKYS
ncbi:hypothetical protein [Algoriphagus sp. CAU 1675]|uniref:hypothetical protein n=1 Tax=Algoriphagus sp. CAU 1675 TaxID=3032597 RepID=UPI0023DCBF6D|nr:hypothetical protein [Algoriphagus sp. CAU 1675]MDF2158839.1 hypothetical protein [Algoriphagus sp. CAU 1675]